jgi:hypothetical protein
MIVIRETPLTPLTRRHTLGLVTAVRPAAGAGPVTGDLQG